MFVPGLAQASLTGLDLGNTQPAEKPTPALSHAGSTETLASPPAPRRLELTPGTPASNSPSGGEGGKGKGDHDGESLLSTIPGTLEDTAVAQANEKPTNSAPAIPEVESQPVDQPKATVPANPGPAGSGDASSSAAPQAALAAPKANPKAAPKAASVPPAVPNGDGDGNGDGDEPNMEGTMYTDGTYWRSCVCIYAIIFYIYLLVQDVSCI